MAVTQGFAFAIFAWRALTWLGVLLAASLYIIYVMYCRITVTPSGVQVIGASWLIRPRYWAPLEAVMLDGKWVLPAGQTSRDSRDAALSFAQQWDWDTDEDYLEIQFYGEDVLHYFYLDYLPEIRSAIQQMVALRQAPEAAAAAETPNSA
ncbi:hypothetical protein B0919_05590 [Hymenobacter sp. CRA2]|nr:hypothetical protein B0919_05590 [Hymenobacter sp. CRA2]